MARVAVPKIVPDDQGIRAGVMMVWCDRRPNPQRSPEWGSLDELKVLATAYHYLCPLDYTELDIREASPAKDPRVVLKRCPKCLTVWYGPTLSELRSRPGRSSGPLITLG